MLSVGFKLLQFDLIFSEMNEYFIGSGWGYVIDAIATSSDQPYQVEMQFPMLLMQMGVVGFLVYILTMAYFFYGISNKRLIAAWRFLLYLLIGFSNPWMFLPSWYLTVALMLVELDGRATAKSDDGDAKKF
jgi:hypothetical protein